MQMRCQGKQKNTFPLKLCALLLVRLTEMGVPGKPDKTSPTPKRRSSSLYIQCPGDTLIITLETSQLPFRG